MRTKLLSPRFLAITKVFVAHTGNTSLHRVISRYHMQTMQVVSVPLGLVSTQVPLTSSSTRSVKLPFFQKAATVVVIVDFARTQDYDKWREEAYARDELNIRANAPSPLLSKSSVQKRGAYFWELTVLGITTEPDVILLCKYRQVCHSS